MSKEREMVLLLDERTKNGTVTWERTGEEDQFVTSTTGGISISIAAVPPREPGDDTPDYILMVKDTDDRDILSIYNSGDEVTFKDLRSLFESARRSVLKIDQTISKIVEDLKRR
jgi:hypothetical protein